MQRYYKAEARGNRHSTVGSQGERRQHVQKEAIVQGDEHNTARCPTSQLHQQRRPRVAPACLRPRLFLFIPPPHTRARRPPAPCLATKRTYGGLSSVRTTDDKGWGTRAKGKSLGSEAKRASEQQRGPSHQGTNTKRNRADKGKEETKKREMGGEKFRPALYERPDGTMLPMPTPPTPTHGTGTVGSAVPGAGCGPRSANAAA